MQHGQRIPFQVSQHAELGVPVMFIDGKPAPSLASPEAAVPASIGDSAQWLLLHELKALRADLERRSFEGRCRRLWGWLKGLFR